jgi:hydroxyethylthiazole kinase
MMSKITGTGCMLSAITSAYCAANPEDTIRAAAASVAAMGICGEIAFRNTAQLEGGTGMFRTMLIDAMSGLDSEAFLKGEKIEIM